MDWIRSFHDQHYHKATGQFLMRNSVSYFRSAERVYCVVCKPFGTTHSKSNFQNLGQIIGDIIFTDLKYMNVQQITYNLRLDEPYIQVIRW